MCSVFCFREERQLGFGWTQLGTGCSLSAVGLRTADQDLHVGQLEGQGHVVVVPVK